MHVLDVLTTGQCLVCDVLIFGQFDISTGASVVRLHLFHVVFLLSDILYVVICELVM